LTIQSAFSGPFLEQLPQKSRKISSQNVLRDRKSPQEPNSASKLPPDTETMGTNGHVAKKLLKHSLCHSHLIFLSTLRFEIPPLFQSPCKPNRAGSRPISTQQGRLAVCSLVGSRQDITQRISPKTQL
jgi:hypothetical protein